VWQQCFPGMYMVSACSQLNCSLIVIFCHQVYDLCDIKHYSLSVYLIHIFYMSLSEVISHCSAGVGSNNVIV
jgi:protein tyrosine phosphatase